MSLLSRFLTNFLIKVYNTKHTCNLSGSLFVVHSYFHIKKLHIDKVCNWNQLVFLCSAVSHIGQKSVFVTIPSGLRKKVHDKYVREWLDAKNGEKGVSHS